MKDRNEFNFLRKLFRTMKVYLVLYWISTAALCLLFLNSAILHFSENADVTLAFKNLGFPTWLVYPLAICKVLAVAVILNNKGTVLKEWAYAGLFFNTSIAFLAHYMIGDGREKRVLMVLILLLASYFLGKKVRP